MLKEFREFAIKGSVVDMAVGIIVGGAFTTVVKSLVDDVMMPPLSLVTGHVDFASRFVLLRQGANPGPYANLAAAKQAGAVVLSYGQFINTIVAFLILSFVLFLVVRWINRLRSPDTPPAPNTKACPYCMTNIASAATRCPACTSQLEEASEAHP